MEGADSLNIRKMAVVAVILLLIFAGQAEGKQSGISPLPINITLEAEGGGQTTPTCGWSTKCHENIGGAGDTIEIFINLTGGPSYQIAPGEHLEINVTTQTSYSIPVDDGIGVMLLNGSYENPMELWDGTQLDNGEGWEIVSSPSGTRNNFHQLMSGAGTGPTNWSWVLKAPSSGETTFVAVMRWDDGTTQNKEDMRMNVSQAGWVTVTVITPEFPYEVLGLILPLALYVGLRRRIRLSNPTHTPPF